MFKHFHPYTPFIKSNTTTLIMGTLPPPRFCNGELKENDVDFCYGSKDNLLWKLLEKIFHTPLLYNPSTQAVNQRKKLLTQYKIGICDIVESCHREKIDASDIGMCEPIIYRDILFLLKKYPTIKTIVFMGGYCKNSPEYFLRKILKENEIEYKHISKKEHYFHFNDKEVQTKNLTSPSNAANRSIGANPLYKENKSKDPKYTTFDFRLEEYKKIFLPVHRDKKLGI
jgi:hypoxanthine-DNA glycosylase